jgi:hypothetical protein
MYVYTDGNKNISHSGPLTPTTVFTKCSLLQNTIHKETNIPSLPSINAGGAAVVKLA